METVIFLILTLFKIYAIVGTILYFITFLYIWANSSRTKSINLAVNWKVILEYSFFFLCWYILIKH